MMETKHFVIAGIAIAVIIGIVAIFLASGDPDGLESSALVLQGDKTLTGETPLTPNSRKMCMTGSPMNHRCPTTNCPIPVSRAR